MRAIVGGRDYGASQFNRATDALRQPGSSFKVIVYLTALLTGKFHPDSAVDASAICIGDYCVHNFDDERGGRMPMYTALALSYNTAAIWLSLKIGEAYWPPGKSYHLAQDGGARPHQDRRTRARDGRDDAVPRHGVAAGRRGRGEDDRHGRRQRDARQRRPSRRRPRGDRNPQFAGHR